MNIVPLSGDFSISLWFNASAFLTNISEFITNPNNGTGGISIGVTNSGKNLFLGSPNISLQNIASYSFVTNQWNHIVVSRKSGIVSSWINNVNQNTGLNTTYDFSGPLAIAWNGDSTNDKSFIGTLDEIGIWNRSLLTAEIDELYNRGFGLTYPFIIPSPSGCTDNTCLNFNPYAIYNDGSCIYPTIPSSNSLIPLNFFQPVTSLSAMVGTTNILFPSFSAGYQDYCVQSGFNEGTTSIPYSAIVNGNTFVGTISSSYALQVIDPTSTAYYIRFLPKSIQNGTAIPLPKTNFGPASGYFDGYYTAANGNFYAIYNKYGVPLWYTTYQPNVQSLELGRDVNRFLTIGDNYTVFQINGTALSGTTYKMAPASDGVVHIIDKHEALEIDTPSSRVGNIVYASYEAAFYIQEQTATRSLVWEFSGSKYFSAEDTEFYHLNSVDVHPVTGDYLVSLRHNSAIICIDYATKNVKWIMQGRAPAATYQLGTSPSPSVGGPLTAVMIPQTTTNTKILSCFNEPTVSGYTYYGTCAQHDAKWNTIIQPLTAGNKIITVLDNQTKLVTTGLKVSFPSAGPQARAVMYEIDETNGYAYHRSSIFSGTVQSTFKGNYILFRENDGSLTHQVYFTAPITPNMLEYKGEVDAPKTLVYSSQFAGQCFRVRKLAPSSIRLDNLRATCGLVFKF
jgi:hypothetical protein